MVAVSIPQVVTEDRASGAQVIDGSLKFSGTNEYLKRTPGSASNQQTWTWSGWLKYQPGQENAFLGAYSDSNNRLHWRSSTDGLHFAQATGGSWVFDIRTSGIFRDIGWYHIVLTADFTNSTQNDRARIYVNGVRQSLGTNTLPANTTTDTWVNHTTAHYLGEAYSSTDFKGSMSQVYLIDGQALDASYFGFTDPLTNTWRPKKYSGTFGTNGFYLPFDGNSPIGKDLSQLNPINNETIWSAGSYNSVTGTTGSVDMSNAFDGSIATYTSLGSGDGSCTATVVFTPPNGFQNVTSLRVYMEVDRGQSISVNGTQTNASVAAGWNDTGFTGTFTNITIGPANSGSSSNISAIEVNGIILVDNMFGNSWTPVHIGGSNVIPKATGALPILNTVSGGNVAIPGVRKDYLIDTPQWLKDSGAVSFGDWASETGPIMEASSTLLNITSDTQTFTIEAWIYPKSIQPQSPAHDYRFTSIVSQGQVYASFGYVDDGKLRWYTYDGTAHYISSASSTIVTGQWQHVACVSNGGTVKLYKNGVEVASGTLEDPNGGQSDDIHIGNADLTYQSDAMLGLMSNLRITNTAVYTAAFTPPTEPLTSISGTQLLCCQSTSSATAATTIATGSITKAGNVSPNASEVSSSCVLALPLVGIATDVSNQINSGSTTKVTTVTNAVASSTVGNFYGGSYYFDGTGDYINVTAHSDLSLQGDFTIECWTYIDTNVANGKQISSLGYYVVGKDGNWYFGLSSTSGYEIVFYTYDGQSNAEYASADLDTPELNKWYHIAAVRIGTTVTLYVDGHPKASGTISKGLDNGGVDGLTLGRISKTGGSSNWGALNGYIQDLRIYNGVGKYTSDFVPASTNPNILPDTPSGVAYGSQLTKVTDGAVSFGAWGGASNPNKYLTVPDSADFTFGSGDFTLEAFVNYADNTTHTSVIQKYTTDNASSSWFWSIYGGYQYFYFYYGSSSVVPTPWVVVPEKAWVHVAVTRDGNTIRVFQDGMLAATGDVTGLTMNDSSVAVTIGSDGDTNYDLDGFVSNARIIKGDIPTDYQTTSTTLYTKVFTPPTAPLTNVTNTKLLCCQSNTSAIAAAVAPGTIVATGAAATNFNPFMPDDINTVMGQETGYATWNALDKGSGLGLGDGNLKIVSVANDFVRSTLSMSSGKWYFEYTQGTGLGMVGLADGNAVNTQYLGQATFGNGYGYYNTGTTYGNNSGGAAYGDSYTTGDVIGVAFDADAGVLTFYNKNISQGAAFTGLTAGPYFFAAGVDTMANSVSNFGQKPFKFPPPEGFQPLNYANLPSPEVVRPDQYVGIATYTGNGTSQSISGYNHSPDLVWIKKISATSDHALFDTVRGPTKRFYPNDNSNEDTLTDNLASFDSNGYTVNDANDVNQSSATYVGWCWKAGGNPGISTTAFWKDDVEYASASDVNMSVGGLYNKSATWSDNLTSSTGAFSSGQGPTQAFNGVAGGSTNMCQKSTGGGTLTWTFSSLSGSVRVWIGNAGGTVTDGNGTVRGNNVGNGGTWVSLSGDISAYNGSIVISVSSDAPSLGAVEVAGKMLVDDDQSPTNLPSIASDGASVGTKQGLSIIKYRGNGVSGATLSHGLSQTPDFFMIKSTIYSYNWNVYHQAMGNTHLIRLNTDAAKVTESGAAWNDTSPTSSVITFGNLGGTNMNNAEYMAYIWHDVPGLQKFGSYKGNDVTDGPFIELGFRPSIVIFKNSSSATEWMIVDSKRDPDNVVTHILNPNDSTGNSNTDLVDFLSNGFKLRSGTNRANESTSVIVYAAWAEAPMNNLFGGQSNAR